MASDKIPPLYRLPNELLQAILHQCDSLESLWSLANTSKRLRAVFTTSPASALNAVLLAAEVPDRIQMVMRAVVYVHSAPLLASALISVEGCYNITLPTSNADANAFTRAPADILLRLLAISHRIHILAHATLDRCRAALVAVAAQTTLGNPSQVADMPISWLEEQQALLAFWQLQLLSGVASAVFYGHVVLQPDDVPTTVLSGVLDYELILTALEQIQWEAKAGDRDEPSLRVEKGSSSSYHAVLQSLAWTESPYGSQSHRPDEVALVTDASLGEILRASLSVLCGDFTLNALAFIKNGSGNGDNDGVAETVMAEAVAPGSRSSSSSSTPVFSPDDPDPAKVIIYQLLHSMIEASRFSELPQNNKPPLSWSCPLRPAQPPPLTPRTVEEPEVVTETVLQMRSRIRAPQRKPKPTPCQPGDVPAGMMLFQEESRGMSCIMGQGMGRIPYQSFSPFRRLGFMLWDGSRLQSAGFCLWSEKRVDSVRIGEWKRVLGWKRDTPPRHIGRKHMWRYTPGDSDSDSEWTENLLEEAFKGSSKKMRLN